MNDEPNEDLATPMHGAFRLGPTFCADPSRQHYIPKPMYYVPAATTKVYGIDEKDTVNGKIETGNVTITKMIDSSGRSAQVSQFPTGRHTHGRTTGSLEHLPLGTQTNCVRGGSIFPWLRSGAIPAGKPTAGIFIKPACLQACSASRMTRRNPRKRSPTILSNAVRHSS